jgi:hypothetical protein
MIYALVLVAALAGPAVPVAPGGVHPATFPSAQTRSAVSPTLSQQDIPALLAPSFQQNQLPPPCPPQKEMPLNGFVTLPVARLGWCNPTDWRPLWYNFQGP